MFRLTSADRVAATGTVAVAVAVAVAVLQGGCSFDSSGINGNRPNPPVDAAADSPLVTDARTDGQIVDAPTDPDLLPPGDGPIKLDGPIKPDGPPAPDQQLPDLKPWPDKQLPDTPWPLDTDADGVPDVSDNCPNKANPGQADGDSDGVGNVCDNCATKSNAGQADGDGDGVGNVCDNCPTKANAGQADADNDTVGDACDNCPKAANTAQADMDSDGQGNVCDGDKDGDSLPNDIDPDPNSKDTVHYYKAPGTASADFTTDGPWSAGSGGSLCHTSTASAYDFTRLKSTLLSATDYLVQTRFTFVSHNTSGGWPAAGLAFRNKSITSPSNYICMVDTLNRRVVLGRFNSGYWSQYAASVSYSVTASSSYTVRAIAKGSNLTCQVVGGPSVTYNSSLHTTGTVGFFTYKVNACFDYLFVTAAP